MTERKRIQNTQYQAFRSEIQNIKANSCRIPQFLDQSGNLRCGGRIHNAPITELPKLPYLLPAKYPFTTLTVQAIHQAQLHSGVNATLTAIRQKFWIPAARRVVRGILRQCVTYQKVTGRPYQAPDPPPLIKARIQESQPFEVSGVDFTGGQTQGKR